MDLQNRTLLVLKYLWETTDENHTVSLADISNFLIDHGVSSPDSRTLKKDITQLIELGIDIVHDRRVQNQYHIATRHFDSPELKLLIDAVQSSRFITPKKSKELIAKLSAFAGPHQTELLHRELYVDRRAKANNENIYLIVQPISHCQPQRLSVNPANRWYHAESTQAEFRSIEADLLSMKPIWALLCSVWRTAVHMFTTPLRKKNSLCRKKPFLMKNGQYVLF